MKREKTKCCRNRGWYRPPFRLRRFHSSYVVSITYLCEHLSNCKRFFIGHKEFVAKNLFRWKQKYQSICILWNWNAKTICKIFTFYGECVPVSMPFVCIFSASVFFVRIMCVCFVWPTYFWPYVTSSSFSLLFDFKSHFEWQMARLWI